MSHKCLFNCPLISVLLIQFFHFLFQKGVKASHSWLFIQSLVTSSFFHHYVYYEIPHCIFIALIFIVFQHLVGHFDLCTFLIQLFRNDFPERFYTFTCSNAKIYVISRYKVHFPDDMSGLQSLCPFLHSLPPLTFYPLHIIFISAFITT